MATLRNIPLSDKRYDEVVAMIRRSYPNACVLWLDQVENTCLEERYESFKIVLQEQYNTVEEKLLFHGTKEYNIKSIADSGFDHTKNVTSAYGKGTYFAKEANYSKNYSTVSYDDVSFMFVCRVALSVPCQGKGYTDIDKTKYSYAVDNMMNPSIFVVPDDEAALPLYIVAFYKNAT
jgi:poly [ADP-ribose] polymerase 7/11/12/13